LALSFFLAHDELSATVITGRAKERRESGEENREFVEHFKRDSAEAAPAIMLEKL
jgi:hypothetical protein